MDDLGHLNIICPNFLTQMHMHVTYGFQKRKKFTGMFLEQ